MDRSYIGKVCKGYCMSRQLYVLTALTCTGRNDITLRGNIKKLIVT